MITRWTVANFKSIREPQSVDFHPLTLLCGPNSAGKSTLLQSMLLFSQSTSARLQPQALQLNGRFVQLGTVYEVLHRRTARSFSVSSEFRLAPDTIRYQFGLRVTTDMRATLDIELVPARPDSGIEPGNAQVDSVALGASAPGIGEARLKARRRRGGSAPGDALPAEAIGTVLSNERYIVELSDASEEGPDRVLHPQPIRSPSGVDLQGPVPTGLWGAYNPLARQVQITLRDLLITPMRLRVRGLELVPDFLEAAAQRGHIPSSPERPLSRDGIIEFIRSMRPTQRRVLRTYVAEYARRIARDQPQVAFERQLLPPLLSSAASGIVSSLTQIRHVGPLREAPRALYALPISADPLEVGSRGEFTAAVLHRFRARPVRFQWESAELEEPLGDAVDRWLAFLGVHEGALTEDYGRLGHVLSVMDKDMPGLLDLTQVGVGVSQLLPIIVQGLLTPPGGTVLFEQPELHLHPGVQARLADFLWSIARSERLVVCETHSEYLITRLRIRLASDALAESDIAIYFASREGGVTRLERIQLDRRGRIRNWPRGFFDQSVMDAAQLVDLQLRT